MRLGRGVFNFRWMKLLDSNFMKKYKERIINRMKVGSEEPTEWTISHLAGSIKNNRERVKGDWESLKSLTKK